MYPSCATSTRAVRPASSARACGATLTRPSRATALVRAATSRCSGVPRSGWLSKRTKNAVVGVQVHGSNALAHLSRGRDGPRPDAATVGVDTDAAVDAEPTATSTSTSTSTRRGALVSAAAAALTTLAPPRAAIAARPLAVVRAEPVGVSSSGGVADVTLSVALPPGYHLTKGANSRYEVEVMGPGGEGDASAGVTVDPPAGKLVDGRDVRVRVTTASGIGQRSAADEEVRVTCTVYFCREDDICLLQRVRFEIPVVEGGGAGEGAAILRYDVPAEGQSQPAAPVASSTIPSLDDL